MKAIILSGILLAGGLTTTAHALPASIGIAPMLADRMITLQLRAEGPGGIIGDALPTYKPGDPKYKEVFHHIGGIKPGEHKSVPPWPLFQIRILPQNELLERIANALEKMSDGS